MIRTVALVAVAALFSGCKGTSTPAAKAPPPATVQNPVKEGDLTSITLSQDAERRLGIAAAAAKMAAVPHTRTIGAEIVLPPGAAVVVSAPVAGRIVATGEGLPAPGTPVRQGQTVFRLQPVAPAERDARVEADRESASAKAQLEAATKKLRRTEQLLTDGAASVRQVEEARTEVSVAEAAVRAADERIASLNRGRLGSQGDMPVDAPMSAVVRSISARAGQTVAGGEPLFEVARLDPIWVRVPMYVGELDSLDLSSGAAMVVRLSDTADAPGRPARRITAPPTADPRAASEDLYFEVTNGDLALKPGARVGVRLTGRGSERRLVVPRAALLHDPNGGTWVYERTKPQTYTRRRVEVAEIVDGSAVIARGLREGAEVVTAGAAELFGVEFGAGK